MKENTGNKIKFNKILNISMWIFKFIIALVIMLSILLIIMYFVK